MHARIVGSLVAAVFLCEAAEVECPDTFSSSAVAVHLQVSHRDRYKSKELHVCRCEFDDGTSNAGGKETPIMTSQGNLACLEVRLR